MATHSLDFIPLTYCQLWNFFIWCDAIFLGAWRSNVQLKKKHIVRKNVWKSVKLQILCCLWNVKCCLQGEGENTWLVADSDVSLIYLFFLFHFFFLIFQKHGHRLMLSRTEWELHPQPPGYKLICWSHSWCKVMLHLWKRLLLAFLINLNYPKQWSQLKYLVCNIFECNHKRCPDQLWLLVRSC